MKNAKTAAIPPRKSEHLSLKAYPEDAQTLGNLQTTRKLDSQGEAFHVLCTHFRGEDDETEQQKCEYLCGEYCGKNGEKIKKVDASYCQACRKSQRVSEQEIKERRESLADYVRVWRSRMDFFERLGVDTHKYHDDESWVAQANIILAQLDAQFSELRQPIAGTLTEIANLKTELEKIIPLETDNAFLRQQLDDLKKDPLAEKCAWQTIELNNKNQEILKLKAENEQQDTAIKAYMFQKGTAK